MSASTALPTASPLLGVGIVSDVRRRVRKQLGTWREMCGPREQLLSAPEKSASTTCPGVAPRCGRLRAGSQNSRPPVLGSGGWKDAQKRGPGVTLLTRQQGTDPALLGTKDVGSEKLKARSPGQKEAPNLPAGCRATLPLGWKGRYHSGERPCCPVSGFPGPGGQRPPPGGEMFLPFFCAGVEI